MWFLLLIRTPGILPSTFQSELGGKKFALLKERKKQGFLMRKSSPTSRYILSLDSTPKLRKSSASYGDEQRSLLGELH